MADHYRVIVEERGHERSTGALVFPRPLDSYTLDAETPQAALAEAVTRTIAALRSGALAVNPAWMSSVDVLIRDERGLPECCRELQPHDWKGGDRG